MKFRFLIFLLLYSSAANSDDGTEQSVDNKEQKKGNTIWLEEKISPTTTWIENLVKPLTVLIEQQINKPTQELENQENSQRIEKETILEPNETGSNEALEPISVISSEQASKLAKDYLAGDILYIKLLTKTNRYRVKLISKLGEVHIIYISATSGDIILPDDIINAEPVKQDSAEQTNQKSTEVKSDDDSNHEHKGKP